MNNLETSTKQTMSHVFQENKLHHSSSTTQSVFTQNKNNKISLLTNTWSEISKALFIFFPLTQLLFPHSLNLSLWHSAIEDWYI